MKQKGIWIDIHIGTNEENPEFTTRKIIVHPYSCSNKSIQEYFLQYEADIAHCLLLRLVEAIKEADGIDAYRQALLKIRKSGINNKFMN